MFHVERNLSGAVNKRKVLSLFILFVFTCCISSRQTVQISDYILVPNGKKITGTNSLVAFVFENNQKKIPIEQYLSLKYNTDNFQENQIWVVIANDKFKIIIYDYSEFEKYFQSANYSVINQEPESNKTGDARKFIAISMVNAANEDCLANNSLFQNSALKYLKKLKDDYRNP